MALAAANAYGVNYRKAFVSKPRQNVEPSDAHGTVRAIVVNVNSVDVATGSGETVTSGDIIYVGGERVPKAAKIIDMEVISTGSATAGAVTLRVDEIDLSGSITISAPGKTGTDNTIGSTYPVTTTEDGILNFTIQTTITGAYDFGAVVYYVQD